MSEKNCLTVSGWRYEGVGWRSCATNGVSLYRQYNPYATTGARNHATRLAENDGPVSVGWRAEGVAWYGVPAVPPERIDGKRVVQIGTVPSSLLRLLRTAPSGCGVITTSARLEAEDERPR